MEKEIYKGYELGYEPTANKLGWCVDIISGWKDDLQKEVLAEMLDGTCGNGVHSDNQHVWDNADEGIRTKEDLIENAKWAIDCVEEKKILPQPKNYRVNYVQAFIGFKKSKGYFGLLGRE